MEQSVMGSQRISLGGEARIAGFCYLLVIAGGIFAGGLVRSTLITPGDVAATAQAIAANEALWRWGLAVHLLYLVPGTVMTVLLGGLFRTVEPTLARLAVAIGVVSVAIEAASLFQLYVPLTMIEEAGALGGLAEGQRQAIAYLAIGLFPSAFDFALLFFAGFCVLIGLLILRTRPVPRVLGGLMLVAGACYAMNTLALLLAPTLSAAIYPAILLPAAAGELSLAVWLVVRGARVAEMQARHPARLVAAQGRGEAGA